MKKIFILLLVGGVFSFFACNNEAESDEGNGEEEVTTEEAVEEVSTDVPADIAAEEQLADHVCNADCGDGNHNYTHGEKGHVCSDACAAKGGDDGGE